MSDDINSETIKTTQKLLGKFVKKPVLTENLLKKPPFRFLHDVVSCVVRENGFLKGLFTEEELISSNVREKEVKIKFLTKLIEAVKSITGKEIKAKPNRIIAGLEPTETNNLLQIIGKALDKKLDSSDYVKKLNKNDKKEKKAKPSTIRNASTDRKTTKTKPTSKNSTPRKNEENNATNDLKKTKNEERPNAKKSNTKLTNKTEERKNIQRTISSSETATIKSEVDNKNDDNNPKITTDENEESETKTKTVQKILDQMLSEIKDDSGEKEESDDPEKIIQNYIGNETIKNVEDDNKVNNESELIKNNVGNLLKKEPQIRPKSARPKSSAFRRERERQEIINLQPAISSNENKTSHELLKRPSTSASTLLRPPSARPSSARPGAPRLKPDTIIPQEEIIPMGKVNVIVENFDKNNDLLDDEEEMVIVKEIIESTDIVTKPLDLPNDPGHLVDQILEQLQEGENGLEKKSHVEIEWEQEENLKGKETANKEIELARATLQKLTKCVNPLGKIMGYLQEDIDAMQAEIKMWYENREQAEKEIEQQKKALEEVQKPLLNQLEDIRENIEKYKKQIALTQANISMNEQRIQKLLIT